MAFSLSSYWNYGSEYCGIEHSATPTGETKIFGLTAISRNGEYEISRKIEIQSLSELSNKLKKNQHCFIIINNDQVLLKATTTNGPDTKIVASAFPNIDLNDFYYNIHKIQELNWVALCRKVHVNDIVKSYETQSISVIGFSLGLLSICPVLPLIQKDSVTTSGYHLIKDNNILVSIEKTGINNGVETYTIGDTKIDSRFLIALSGIFLYNLFTGVGANNKEKNNDLKKIHQQKVFFRKGIITGVSVMLLALLINFFFFSSYYSSLQSLLAQHNVELAQQDVFQKQAQLLAEKEKIVKNIHANSTSRSTYYLNRVISTKPATVLLSEFIFQPLRNQIKKNEAVDLDPGIIVLRGESQDEGSFSAWIKQLEGTAWVQKVTVSEYGYKEKKNSEFVISLKLKQDETGE